MASPSPSTCQRCGSTNLQRKQLTYFSYGAMFDKVTCLKCGWAGDIRLNQYLDPTTSRGKRLWIGWLIAIGIFAVVVLLVIGAILCLGMGFLMSLQKPPGG
jgi:ribosomal protein L40E